MNDLLTYRLRVEEELPETLEVVDIRKIVPYIYIRDLPQLIPISRGWQTVLAS